MKSLWLRLYTETLNDPKVQRLDAELFRAWINLLCIAKGEENGGILPEPADIAFLLRRSEEETKEYLDDLVEAGLVDITEYDYSIHGWCNRQYESDDDPTAAIRKRRQRGKPVTDEVTRDMTVTSRVTENSLSQNVTRTESETETETETETENTNTWSPSAPAPENTEPKPKRSIHPTLDEVKAYCSLRGNAIDPEQWYSYYQANGWKVGRNPMKDWQAAVRTWEKNGVGPPRKPQQTPEQTAARKEALQILEDFRRSKR